MSNAADFLLSPAKAAPASPAISPDARGRHHQLAGSFKGGPVREPGPAENFCENLTFLRKVVGLWSTHIEKRPADLLRPAFKGSQALKKAKILQKIPTLFPSSSLPSKSGSSRSKFKMELSLLNFYVFHCLPPVISFSRL